MKPEAAKHDFIDFLSNSCAISFGIAWLSDGIDYHTQGFSLFQRVTVSKEGPEKLFPDA